MCVDINGPQDEEDDKGKGAANECGRDVELGSLCVNHADQRNSRNGTQIQKVREAALKKRAQQEFA